MIIRNLLVNYESDNQSPLCIHCGLERKEKGECISVIYLYNYSGMYQL